MSHKKAHNLNKDYSRNGAAAPRKDFLRFFRCAFAPLREKKL